MPDRSLKLGGVYLVFASILLLTTTAKAEYAVTGPVIAWETHGIGITVIDKHEIVAVEKDGQLYEFKTLWDAVDKYDSYTGKCTLYVKHKGGTASGPIAWAINAVKAPILLERTEKGYRRVDADYVTFQCIRR